MFLDKAGNVVKGASTKSFLAVGVPGTVSGLEEARVRAVLAGTEYADEVEAVVYGGTGR